MKAVTRVLAGLSVLAIAGVAQPETNANPTNSSPIAVSADGQTVWVVNPESGTVAEIGANSLTRIGEFSLGHNPRTVALLGSQYVYATAQDDDLVLRLDQATGGNLVSYQLPFGCAPYGVAVNVEGTRVYVTCERTDTLVVLDTGLMNVLATVAVLPTPRGIAVAGDDQHLYLSHFLTKEPNTTGHVTEIDATTNTVSRVFDIPIDTSTCETIDSAQGVFNLMQSIAITPPGSPAGVANQVWVAGEKQNVAGKGLFIRSTYFQGRPEAARFPFPFTSFPGTDVGSQSRNRFKASFHDIIRGFMVKIDLSTGTVNSNIDVKGANLVSGFAFSPDGTAVASVDANANRFQYFNTARTGTVDDDPPAHSPGNCTFNPFDTQSERPFIMPPQLELKADDPAPLEAGGVALTGLDYDVSMNAMKPISDGIGTTPIGVAVSPDGTRAYTANFLSRTVSVVDLTPGSGRCANSTTTACNSPLDCPDTGQGVCGNSIHGGMIQTCTSDADCGPGIKCTHPDRCLPQIITVINTTGNDPLPPELLDGEILFNTAARDSSLGNNIGLDSPVPPSNFQDPNNLSGPGEVISTSHDAEYLTCASCHVEAGNDGRTWDFSQFGAALRNTMDLRGRSSFAPGTCGPNAKDAGMVGKTCHYDSECGSGSPLSTCQANPAFVPMDNPAVAANKDRFFNPMGSIHWSGDRDEAEDFEHTYRSLHGAGDCDGNEDHANACIGALIMRDFTTDPADVSSDLGAPNRAIPGTSGIAGIRLTHMADYIYSETEFLRNPNLGAHGENVSRAAARGLAIFNDPRVGCAGCHNGPSATNQLFTDKRPLAVGEPGFDPSQPANIDNNPFFRHNVGTANIFDLTDPFVIAQATANGAGFQNPFIPIPGHRGPATNYLTPTLVDAWNTAPYLHDGSAATLMDVIRPCSSHFQDCNDPTAGRNVDDRHGHTSFLTQDQLADLEAFLKAPHGTIASGPTEANLILTTGSFAAPGFGFTFPVSFNNAPVGMRIDSLTGQVMLHGSEFPEVTFDTGIAGGVTIDVAKQDFPGTIDAAGNITIPNIAMTLSLAGSPIAYVFTLQTGTKTLDGFSVNGTPFNPQDGSVTLADIELGPPVPVLGAPVDTVVQFSGTIDTAPLFIARSGSITGTVQNGSGQPVAGARVVLRHGTRRTAKTDASGQFTFQNLRLGGYQLLASKPSVGAAAAQVLLNAGQPTQNVTVALH